MAKKKNQSLFKNYDTRLREFLMTTFLVIIVYELISKIFWNYYFNDLYTCKTIINNGTYFLDIFNSIVCGFQPIINIIPNWLFSTFPGANSNFLVTIFSLMTTGFLIGTAYKFAKFIYKHEDIKNYMKGEGRKELYTDEFGALLLLTFMIFGVIILILYPVFGIIFLVMIIRAIVNERNNN